MKEYIASPNSNSRSNNLREAPSARTLQATDSALAPILESDFAYPADSGDFVEPQQHAELAASYAVYTNQPAISAVASALLLLDLALLEPALEPAPVPAPAVSLASALLPLQSTALVHPSLDPLPGTKLVVAYTDLLASRSCLRHRLGIRYLRMMARF